MANLLCGCPSLSLPLGLVAMAMRVGRSIEPQKGNENMSLERPSRLTKNRYTSTSLSLQAKTVYQIRMCLAVVFVILAIHSSDLAHGQCGKTPKAQN